MPELPQAIESSQGGPPIEVEGKGGISLEEMAQ